MCTVQVAMADKHAVLWHCLNCDEQYVCWYLTDTYAFWKEGYSNCCNSIRWEVWKLSITHKELFKCKLRNDYTIAMHPKYRLERIA